MDGIPVLAFVGYSGVGKTTLLEKLVTSLKARGLRLAVVKHDGHEFAADCAFFISTSNTVPIPLSPLSFPISSTVKASTAGLASGLPSLVLVCPSN